ncbi:uncharacterized protein LY89DRAFT_679028 [Mollisia scopiformis]|uniref:Uncharacterized protein n=1 Tax=Mollisia scopiformis TaxID=149040 RepID=A0A194XU71_MOLSC|nr:uncharacterized protein LY89DRAFT_679028 [Mollisia scopiformis]KUJ23686.1 hypothetical protein LY89DRAFT_679028 [Mollisia scopiformis]
MYGDYRKVELGPDEVESGSEGSFERAEYNDVLKAQSRTRIARVLKMIKVSVVTLLAIWGFINIFNTVVRKIPFLNPPVHHGCYCGKSSTEAIAMGCKYDSLAAAWLPEHCRDDDLTAEFDRSGDGPNGTWLYWKDKARTIPITPEEIQWMGDTPDARFHMDYSWHEVHCLFYWRKEHRFRFNGKILDPRSDSEEHILHCGDVWGRKVPYGMGTVSGVRFDTNTEN